MIAERIDCTNGDDSVVSRRIRNLIDAIVACCGDNHHTYFHGISDRISNQSAITAAPHRNDHKRNPCIRCRDDPLGK